MGGEGESVTCDHLRCEWVRTPVPLPPQRCTGEGSTRRPAADPRRHGARQGCTTGEPRARRQTPVSQVAMGKVLHVREQPSSEPARQSGLTGVVQKDRATRAMGSPLPGMHSTDPADRTTLTRGHTHSRNGETPGRLSRPSVEPRAGRHPQAGRGEGWRKKPTPRGTPEDMLT